MSYWNQVLEQRVNRRRALISTGGAAGAAAFLAACGGSSDSGGLKLDDSATSRKPGTVWFSSKDWTLEDETSKGVRGGIYRSARTTDHAGHFDAMTLPPSQVPSSAHVHEFL